MKYGSVCSGIEAASVAWHHLGWEAQWFSEIEHFPSEVLKYRFPAVENLGDMTKLTTNETFKASTIDLLVGGTPCQSFSVAGLRGGLADPRGNLMLTFLSLADAKKPRWIVWENVPGVLSSNGGKDFGTFLGALGELGYGFAFRILNAEHFGIPQRRRRVFVVGYLGDWRVAAAVLLERESLQRDIKPSRKKREEVAPDAEGSVGEADKWVSPNGEETIGTLRARDYKGLGNDDLEQGRGLAIKQPTIIDRAAFNQGENAQYEPRIEAGETMSSLVARGPHAVAQPIAFKVRGGCEGGGKGYLGQEERAFTISAAQDQQIAQPIAYSFDALSSNSMKSSNPHSGCREVDVAKTLDTTTPEPSKNQGGIAIAQPIAVDWRTAQVDQGITQTLKTDLAKMSGPCVAVDTYNYTTNDHTTQTIRSQSDTEHIGAVLQQDNPKSITFVDKGINYGGTQKNNTVEVLRELRRKIGEEAFAQWGLGILNSLQSAQILQSDLYGNSIRPATFSTSWPIYCKISRKEDDSSWLLQSLREAECERCSPQGWELSEQLHRELGSYLSELSCEGASPKRFMQDLWNADEGTGLLRKALSEIQEIRQPIDDKSESTQGCVRIRRLVPIETELLQGFPRNWTQIPYRNKPADQCPDGPRYKACGNSMAVPVMRWIGERIQLIDTIVNG